MAETEWNIKDHINNLITNHSIPNQRLSKNTFQDKHRFSQNENPTNDYPKLYCMTQL